MTALSFTISFIERFDENLKFSLW